MRVLGRSAWSSPRLTHPTSCCLTCTCPFPGRDVLAALKRDARTAPIPVAILTADARIGRPRELVDAGAYRFLTKPVDVDEILDLLDSVTAGEKP